MAQKDLLKQAETHAKAGRIDKATQLCLKLLAKDPGHTEATFLLSGVMMIEKRYADAEPLLRKVLDEDANHISAMNNMGVIYREYYNDFQKAEALFKRVAEANPGHFRSLMNLGSLYCDLGQDDLGEVCFKEALAVNPESVETAIFLSFLGSISYRKRDYDEAISYYQRALIESPEDTNILRNYILALFAKGDHVALLALIKDVLKLPDAGKAYFPAFSILKRYCFWEQADDVAKKVLSRVEVGENDYSALEMCNLDLLAVEGVPYEKLLMVHKATGVLLEKKRMGQPYTRHEKAMAPISKLKVAYLSGDFRGHVINTFIRGLFNFHDRDHFELYCYSNTQAVDETTTQYEQAADVFVDITSLRDVDVAARIHADGIHILVNLAGYTADSRMEVMAYRPAPVQIMYLGYPYTSGLSTVDYFVSDPYLDGPKNAPYFVEKQLRLPECFATFEALHDQEIVSKPTFEKNGHITFGTLVNAYKLTPSVIQLWAQIMTQVEGSRIILNNPRYNVAEMRENIWAEFLSHGIATSRVDIIYEKHESGFHLRYYNDIDIALDTFPLTGGTTTHEALWMGVPVVTLVGDIYPHRLSYTILSNAGMDLSELIAFSSEEYRAKACALSHDTERLSHLHRVLPKALKTSIQCQPIRHTEHMEMAYVEAWNRKFPEQQIHHIAQGEGQLIPLADLLDAAIKAVKNRTWQQGKALCRKIFDRDPENLEALALLGTIHLMEKNYSVATECFEAVRSVLPNDVSALNNLGLIQLEHVQDLEAAEAYFKAVLSLRPNHVNGLMNLGNVYRASHELDQARVLYEKALVLDPENGTLLNNLGSLYTGFADYEKAKRYYERALLVLPGHPEVTANVMTVNRILGDNARALQLISTVLQEGAPGISVFPAYSAAKMYCLWADADALLPKVQDMMLSGKVSSDAFLEMNLSLLATPELSNASHRDGHKKAGLLLDQRREGVPFSSHPVAMQNKKKIRVGYLSPDLYQHVLSIGFRGLMHFHDSDRFEIFCYSSSKIEDKVTAEYKARATQFINVMNLSDRALAERIREDGIHLLVDLAGYTTGSRMAVMSYRPAPVQLMYLGYPYTSGLDAVDYFITDPFLDGPQNADYFTEKQLRLPESFFAVGQLTDAEIVDEMPFEREGHITFGSMNNAYKLNLQVVETWSAILKQVPESCLILNHPNFSQEKTRKSILDAFEANGIRTDRIDIIWDAHPLGSHFLYYNDFDIVLDAFPVTGGTSTIDAVSMGAVVVTLVGEIYPHRLSYSILKNIGLDVEDLIAFDSESYIEKAVALASNPMRLRELHRGIPKALKTSILSDPYRLTRQMEAAYIRAWNQHCPAHAVSFEISEKNIGYVALMHGLEIAVPDGNDVPERYILSEKAAWFDPEYDFVQRCVSTDKQVLDIGAGIGYFSIPFAQSVGASGGVWAFTPSSTEAAYLHYSKNRNGLTQLRVRCGESRQSGLSSVIEEMLPENIDLIRIGHAEALDEFLDVGGSLLSESDPLILFRIKGDDQNEKESPLGLAALLKFKSLGYQSYRHIPGLDLLIPFSSEVELDAFALNLFVCKAGRADQLASCGLLLKSVRPLSVLPDLGDLRWQAYIGAAPYAQSLVSDWVNHPIEVEALENYWMALNLFVKAKESQQSPAARYAALNASFGMMAMILETKPTLPRILSLIRVMLELGKREAAVNFLNQVVSLFESGEKIALNEPFLAFSDEEAALVPGTQFSSWLFASVLKTRENYRAFSTYFSGTEALPVLESVMETGFGNRQIEKQIELLRARFPELELEGFPSKAKVSVC